MSISSPSCSGVALLLVLAFSAAPEQSSPATPWVDSPGAPLFFAVSVADIDRAADWYAAAFGVERLDDQEAGDGSWRIANLGGENLAIELIRDDRDQAAARVRGIRKVGFGVADVAIVADRVERSTGARPDVLDIPRHGIRILQLRDPDGNVVQLSSRLQGDDGAVSRRRRKPGHPSHLAASR